MDQEPDVIRQDIEQTRESLTEKLETLECEVKGTIADAKDTVTAKSIHAPLIAGGATPIGASLQSFRTWFSGCASGACPANAGWKAVAAESSVTAHRANGSNERKRNWIPRDFFCGIVQAGGRLSRIGTLPTLRRGR